MLLLLQHHIAIGWPRPAALHLPSHLRASLRPLLLLRVGRELLSPGAGTPCRGCTCPCCHSSHTSWPTWPALTVGHSSLGATTAAARRPLASRQWGDPSCQTSGPIRLAAGGDEGLCRAKQATHWGTKGPWTEG